MLPQWARNTMDTAAWERMLHARPRNENYSRPRYRAPNGKSIEGNWLPAFGIAETQSSRLGKGAYNLAGDRADGPYRAVPNLPGISHYTLPILSRRHGERIYLYGRKIFRPHGAAATRYLCADGDPGPRRGRLEWT
ncbi:MAG: hypothetical protein [Olavius algarvensis Gamma 1 endosymbiont]|nr:MAG: hypothetical protein [Olavius algarvensis Gamma 1 endosymbiont]